MSNAADAPDSADRDDDAYIQTLIATSGWDIPEREHATRTGQFAADLFDGLHETLGLSHADRRLAIAAGTFHDIGYLRAARDHHRKSFDLLRDATQLPFTTEQRLIIACAARYHGHSSPSIEHSGFNDMSFDDQRRVRRLSAVVRLAAALDASHLGLIDSVRVDVSGDVIVLNAHAVSEPAVERDRLRESAGGFQHLTQLKLRIDVVVGQPSGEVKHEIDR